MYACELGGIDDKSAPESYESAQWDGRSFHITYSPIPLGADRATIDGVPCFALSCVAVGAASARTGRSG